MSNMMFNKAPSERPSLVEQSMTMGTQFVNGKYVDVYSPQEIEINGSFRDLDIQVFIDAGLFDKLAKGKKVQVSMLERQDQLFEAAEAINKLHLENEVETKRQQYRAELDAKIAELDAQKQQLQPEPEPQPEPKKSK